MEEEYILSKQPVELLLKQLSDPEVTLQDIESFCAVNREVRELCLNNPLFRKLREGKRVAVDISLEMEEESVYTISIEFHHHIKTFPIYTLILQDNKGGKTFFSKMLNFAEILKVKHYIDFYGGSLTFEVKEDGTTVSIDARDEDGDAWSSYELSLDFLSSAWDIIRDLVRSWERMRPERIEDRKQYRWYGDAQILMNGDVIYKTPREVFIQYT